MTGGRTTFNFQAERLEAIGISLENVNLTATAPDPIVMDIEPPYWNMAITPESDLQFEVEASPRGKPWYLTRRVAEEDSVACRRHADLTGAPGQDSRSVYLSSVFLANRARVNPNRKSLAYTLSLGVRVPDYEIERRMWLDGLARGGGGDRRAEDRRHRFHGPLAVQEALLFRGSL